MNFVVAWKIADAASFDHVNFVCGERQRIEIRQRMEADYSLPNLDSLSSLAPYLQEVSTALISPVARLRARHRLPHRYRLAPMIKFSDSEPKTIA